MNVLVTGATGLFGPILVESLLAGGHQVRCLVHRRPAPAGAQAMPGDISRAADVQTACEGMDCICHLATVKGNRDSFLEVNLRGLYHLLEYVRLRRGPLHLIVLSGDNVLPIFDHENPAPMDEKTPYLYGDDEYGLSKVLEETMALQYVRKYGLPVTVLRSSWIMEGMRSARLCHPKKGGWKKYLAQDLLKKFENNEPFRIVPHDKYGKPLKRHVVDPRDLAGAFLRVLMNKKAFGGLYNISGPTPFDYKELADYLNKKAPLPAYPISTPDAFSFEINTEKAEKIGFQSEYSIFDTVDWAVASHPGESF
jgi:nucleoside-diphosphate-sugar epimerase